MSKHQNLCKTWTAIHKSVWNVEIYFQRIHSFKVFALLGYYAAEIDSWFPMFWNILPVLPFQFQNYKISQNFGN